MHKVHTVVCALWVKVGVHVDVCMPMHMYHYAQVLVRKETRSIPSLIFSMEQLEKFLIQLSKKSKVKPSMLHCIVEALVFSIA